MKYDFLPRLDFKEVFCIQITGHPLAQLVIKTTLNLTLKGLALYLHTIKNNPTIPFLIKVSGAKHRGLFLRIILDSLK